MDAKSLGNYVVFDDKMMTIEQSPSFPEELLGDISSVLYHSKKVCDDNQLFLDAQFENGNLNIMNDTKEKTSICTINKKK